jgi:hypothetical protein
VVSGVRSVERGGSESKSGRSEKGPSLLSETSVGCESRLLSASLLSLGNVRRDLVNTTRGSRYMVRMCGGAHQQLIKH